jgi:hypothetical protein
VGVGHGPDALWGVIKGISDFADEDRTSAPKEVRQRRRDVACQNAVRFALGTVAAAMAPDA